MIAYGKKFCCASFLILGLIIVASPIAEAARSGKNLTGRLGVGFTNQIAVTQDGTIPAVSGKYFLSPTTASSIAFGMDTRSSNSTVAIGTKLYKELFPEDNMIFYSGLGVALVSKSGTKFQFSAFLGSEFFLAGLPSLGLSFEAGIRGDSTSGTFAIRTIGESFLTAGMHFYF